MTGSDVPLLTRPSLVGGEPLYLSGEDALRLTAFNALTGVTLTLSGRFLPVSRGEYDAPRPGPFTHTLAPATDRTASTLTRGLGEGWLLEASVTASAATPLIGQCFATLSVVRGLASSGLELSTLAQGYVTSKQRIAWPGGLFGSSLDGGGALRSIAGATPGAGAEISETVPTGARWELLAFAAQLVTAVAVANRNPSLVLDDGANVYARCPTTQIITASLTYQVIWGQGMSGAQTTAANIATGPVPINIRVGSGHRVRTSTTGLQAADQWSTVQYLVREWIEGA